MPINGNGGVASGSSFPTIVLGSYNLAFFIASIPACLLTSWVFRLVEVVVFKRRFTFFCNNSWGFLSLLWAVLIIFSAAQGCTARLINSSTALYVGLNIPFVYFLGMFSRISSTVSRIILFVTCLKVFFMPEPFGGNHSLKFRAR